EGNSGRGQARKADQGRARDQTRAALESGCRGGAGLTHARPLSVAGLPASAPFLPRRVALLRACVRDRLPSWGAKLPFWQPARRVSADTPRAVGMNLSTGLRSATMPPWWHDFCEQLARATMPPWWRGFWKERERRRGRASWGCLLLLHQLLAHGRRRLVHGNALAARERAHIRHHGPTLEGRDLDPVRRHQAVAGRDDPKEHPGRLVGVCGQRRRRPQAHLARDLAVAVAEHAVAGCARNLEAPLSQSKQLGRDRQRDARSRLTAHDALGQRRVADDALARDGPGRRHPHRAPVVEEVALSVRRKLGLDLHRVEIGGMARGHAQAKGRHPRAPHLYTWMEAGSCTTVATCSAPSRDSSSAACFFSNSAGANAMETQNRSMDARRNASTSNTGWYGLGSRISAITPKNPEKAPSSTPTSKVIGMKVGGLCGGRPPMLIGKS